jgi:glucose/arabinose dehydrogenase
VPQVSRALVFTLVILAVAIACAPPGQPTPTPASRSEATPDTAAKAKTTATNTPAALPTPEPRTHNAPTPVAQVPDGIKIADVVSAGIIAPSALTFAPDRRLFFNEVKTGAVRILDPNGQLQPQPFVTVSIPTGGDRKEQGALGLALHPDFATNHYVYVFYTYAKDGIDPDENRVVRFTERDGVGTDEQLILKDLPVGICCHNGGRIGFGPDGKLYVTVGDQNDDNKAQQMNRPHGKVLRVNPDGSIPQDNPFPDTRIFALGFRNPWGLAFHPKTGVPYITENGEVGHDEVNRVLAGRNYGNPIKDGMTDDPQFTNPIWETGVGRIAPTGAAFYTGQAMPEYQGDFFFCSYNTGDMTRMRFGGPDFDQLVEHDVVAKGCYLDVVNGPDGALYFAGFTSIHRFGR